MISNSDKITLVCVEDRFPDKAKKLISHQKNLLGITNSILFGDFTCDVEIPKINSSFDYSKFIIKELYKFIKTEFVLICQLDGFAINPLSWTDHFLKYDYIGAPWFFIPTAFQVGNGGFSLRSKRLLDICAKYDYNISCPPEEDVFICRSIKNSLTEQGIRFAPVEVASMFSVENKIYENQFGFHGPFTIKINRKLQECIDNLA
jgi:Protein of unknown function (DUF5672)